MSTSRLRWTASRRRPLCGIASGFTCISTWTCTNARYFRANGYAFPGGPSPDKVRRDLVGLVRELPVAALSVTSLDPDLPDAEIALACAAAHIKAVCDAQKAVRC